VRVRVTVSVGWQPEGAADDDATRLELMPPEAEIVLPNPVGKASALDKTELAVAAGMVAMNEDVEVGTVVKPELKYATPVGTATSLLAEELTIEVEPKAGEATSGGDPIWRFLLGVTATVGVGTRDTEPV